MSMWAETPEDPLSVKPVALNFGSDLSQMSERSVTLGNRLGTLVAFQLKILGPKGKDYSVRYQKGFLKHMKGKKIKVQRPAGFTPPEDKEYLLIEHILLPDDVEESVKNAWKRAKARKVEPWHHLVPIQHSDAGEALEADKSSSQALEAQGTGQWTDTDEPPEEDTLSGGMSEMTSAKSGADATEKSD